MPARQAGACWFRCPSCRRTSRRRALRRSARRPARRRPPRSFQAPRRWRRSRPIPADADRRRALRRRDRQGVGRPRLPGRRPGRRRPGRSRWRSWDGSAGGA
ncbi:hypothetical protein CKO24_12700 [Rhodothalassium salexigens DSM 2132]|nr:hypothetical protein [Rhodothalassium salexigens DSM 2132]